MIPTCNVHVCRDGHSDQGLYHGLAAHATSSFQRQHILSRQASKHKLINCCESAIPPTCFAEVELLQMAVLITHEVTDVAQVFVNTLGSKCTRQTTGKGHQQNTFQFSCLMHV